jgi:hypothetical protein
MVIGFPVRSPSVQRMVKELKIPLGSAQSIKQMCDHGRPIAALTYADEVMKGSGIETGYPEYPQLVYVNMGDTYSRTLYYNGTSVMIGSWGDYVERHRGVAHNGSNPRNPKHWR